jgi:hypothetical protein
MAVALCLREFPSFSGRITRRPDQHARQRIITVWFLRTSLTTESSAQKLLVQVLKARQSIVKSPTDVKLYEIAAVGFMLPVWLT